MKVLCKGRDSLKSPATARFVSAVIIVGVIRRVAGLRELDFSKWSESQGWIAFSMILSALYYPVADPLT